MNKSKKVLTIVLAFIMVLSLVPIQVDAAKKVKLNKSKLSLNVGKSYTLKLKNNKRKVKWSSSKKKIATVTKKGKVTAKKTGNCNITAKVGKKKYVCKVTVKNKKSIVPNTNNNNSNANTTPQMSPTPTPVPTPDPSPTPSERKLIYDYSQEAPYIANYDEFKFNSFRMWLCPFLFYGEGIYKSEDYRGKKLHYELTIKNSGERDLPVLDICFNYTSPTVYPTVFRVHDPADDTYGDPTPPDPADYPMIDEYEGEEWLVTYEEALEEYNQEKAVTLLEQPIKKGQIYTYSFDFTIPSYAINGDMDTDFNCPYPIMMYISNCKDINPYISGDEITILGLKIYE